MTDEIRDVTPATKLALDLSSLTPGYAPVMDSIRAKYGDDEPTADISFASLLRNGPAFESIFLQGNRTMAVPVEPQKLSERLSIQQGTFLCAGNVNASFMDNLTAMDDWKSGVKKFTLQFAQRGRALENLRLMNITRATLFPGLDGFAQSFRQLLVREPRSVRGLRLAIEGDPSIRDPLREASDAEPKP